MVALRLPCFAYGLVAITSKKIAPRACGTTRRVISVTHMGARVLWPTDSQDDNRRPSHDGQAAFN